MKICVYGASSTGINRIYTDEAYRLGMLMARRGHSLVYGGGAQSVMGAVARGVRDHGGKVTGVAPEFFRSPEVAGDGVLSEQCDAFIHTKTMRQRKQTMEDLADAFIAAPGGVGTLEEFAEILTLRQLGQQEKPLVLLNTDGFYDGLYGVLDAFLERGFMKKTCPELFLLAGTPEEALDYIEGWIPKSADAPSCSEVPRDVLPTVENG